MEFMGLGSVGSFDAGFYAGVRRENALIDRTQGYKTGFEAMVKNAYSSLETPENSSLESSMSPRAVPVSAVTANAVAPIDKSDKLYGLCLDLETFLIKNLLSSMRNTVQKTGFVDDSFAGKIYEDMLYDEYAKEYAKTAGFGLAEQAYRQLKRNML
ncbi:MAG: rod-binding protein [Treponema sp.]|jgi:flagellar protein FlgJ|nr:rod-binding protein [Treponema sp.]